MSFKHYVISRFCIYMPDKPQPSQEWLDYRLDLFKKFTYPSMVKQTNQNFEWLVLINREEQKQIFSSFLRCKPLLCEDRWVNTVRGYIKDNTKEDWLISTRVDNDDALNVRYIAEVQRNFREKREVINYRRGMCYNTETGKKTLRRLIETNMFLSTYENIRNKKFKTCYAGNHGHINQYFSIRSFENLPPMWLMVCHGGNLLNRAVGDPTTKSLKCFGVEE